MNEYNAVSLRVKGENEEFLGINTCDSQQTKLARPCALRLGMEGGR